MKKKDNVEIDKEKEKNNFQETNDYEFIREKIKKRPVNRRRLARKMLITAGSAVLFSIIACITFIFLEPVLDKMVNKESEGDTTFSKVVLNEDVSDEENESDEIEAKVDDTPYEEIPIENLNLVDDETVPVVSENTVSMNSTVYVTETVSLELDDYQYLHRKLYTLSEEVKKSMVTVTGMSTDMDVLNDTYLSTHRTSGVIIAESTGSLYVLASGDIINDADKYTVTFCNGDTCPCEIKAKDEDTNLVVYEVKMRNMTDGAKASYTVATLGSSVNKTLLGNVVMAVGDPLCVGESICYGSVTSNVLSVGYSDSSYQIITTDIYGSPHANGILVNTRGQVVGLISEKCKQQGMENLVCAYGITGIKSLMEKLSNGSDFAYVGLNITNVTSDVKENLQIPGNLYVTKVDNNSPASHNGLAAGDVITSINGEYLSGAEEYMRKLYLVEPGDDIEIGYKRLNGGTYEDMSVTVTTGVKE